MDESSSLSLIVWARPLLALIIASRLLNNLLRAGYFGLGRISLLALAERAKESSPRLWNYLEHPNKLNLASLMLDKLLLFFLVLCGYYAVGEPRLLHFLLLLAYLAIFDFALPNTVAAFFPEQLVLRLFPVLRLPFEMMSPLTFAASRLMRQGAANRDMEDDGEDEDPEDIKAFLRAGREEGIIEDSEAPMFNNLFQFNDTVVREVMTPRTDMACADIALSKQEILDAFKTTRFSRLPVYRGNIDHIVGFLRFKDIFDLMEDKSSPPDKFINELLFVPEGKNISDLLQEMLTKRRHMAVVIDEFGGTAGVITLEDLVEEIIGEIHDEHERPELDEIIDLGRGAYSVDGKVSLSDFAELFDIDIENTDVDTVGGYIFNHEGRIPKEGEKSRIGPLEVEIAKADERRIYKITAVKQVGQPEPSAAERAVETPAEGH